ncbi:hypothetical protein FPV67DRAFT_1437759, partial [Lyophyllum atratum]
HFNEPSPCADVDVLLTFISCILRLSKKYIILELRKRCLALLVVCFSTLYQGYLAPSSKPFTPSTGSTEYTTDHDDMYVYSTTTFTLIPSTNPTQPDTSAESQPQPLPSRSSS